MTVGRAAAFYFEDQAVGDSFQEINPSDQVVGMLALAALGKKVTERGEREERAVQLIQDIPPSVP
jgi:hypothetical protein